MILILNAVLGIIGSKQIFKILNKFIAVEAIFITSISGYVGLITGIGILKLVGNTLEEDYYILDPYVDLNTWIYDIII